MRKIGGFDEVIDVRSPAEFEDDHIPGASEFSYQQNVNQFKPMAPDSHLILTSSMNIIAVNLPVLDNAERAEVGTLHNSRVLWHVRICLW